MPDWKPHIRSRLASLRLSPTRENEIVEELSQHLDDRWRELVAGGTPEAEATSLALAGFRDGNLLARHLAPLRQAHAPVPLTPGAPAGRLLGDLWQDLRYAARALRRQPTFALAAVLTLALGIGSNAAIFSVVDAVLLRPLPFAKSEQLVAVYTRYLPSTGYDFPYFSLSGAEFADVASRVDAFAAIAAYDFRQRNVVGQHGEAEYVATMPVTASFFDVLGVKPIQGRIFTQDEAQGGGRCVALVGEDWSVEAASAIGSTIRLDDAPCEVIGVLPREFSFGGDRAKVWTPLRIDTAEEFRQSHTLLVIARLRDGIVTEQADAQLQVLRAYWSEAHPNHYAKGHFVVIRPLQDDLVGDHRDALIVLAGAVLFVLLLVCVNLTALLVSRGEARRREFAVRHALGANRRRLVRQLVVEALLLAAIGGVFGVLLAQGMLAALLELYPRRVPVSQPIAIDNVALLYTFALVIMSGFLVGVVPALRGTGMRLQDALSGDSRTATSSRAAVAMRSALVVGQLAVSVILLAGALLLVRSYQQLQRVDLGIQAERVLTFSLSIPRARQDDPVAARQTLVAVEDRLMAVPGVETVGAVSNLPLVSAGPPDDFVINGRAAPPPGAPGWNARYLMATPRMFRALGVTLKRGRLLADSDVPGQPFVAVVNETAARLYWPGEDVIGRTIRYYPIETSPSIHIVGIVGDVRSIGASTPAPPAIYVPFAQAPRPAYDGRAMTFVVRATGDPVAITPSVRTAVADIAAGLPLANVRPMTAVVADTTGQPRFTTLVMSFFAGVAFFLAGLGLYGILALLVEQRTREIGVRVALGADRREIFRLIIGRGMRLALVGVLVGVPAALALTRLMSGVLSGLATTDPMTYAAVAALLGIAAFLASYLPARRATRIDPLVALRTD
jgi:putative ABC transport system permease protein